MFVQYFELTPPKQSSGSYVEEFLRIQNYTRGMPEDERVLMNYIGHLTKVPLDFS